MDLTPPEPLSVPCISDLLPVNKNESDESIISPDTTTTSTEDEILELASIGGIQFVRATDDGRYEIMSSNEARDLMAQNSHDVTFFSANDNEIIGNDLLRGYSGGDFEMISPDLDDSFTILDTKEELDGLTLGDIEILQQNNDICVLDPKNFESHYNDGLSYLSQAKLDDIIQSKAMDFDPAVSIPFDDSKLFKNY